MFDMMGKPKMYLEPDTGADAGAVDGSEADEGNLSKGQEAGKTPAWMAQLPDDLKADENLAQYKTLGQAIKGLMENKPTPVEEAEPVEVQYGEFKTTIPAEDDPFGNAQETFVELCKSMKFTQDQAEEFIAKVNEANGKVKQGLLEKGRELAEKTMKASWGRDYDTKRALMARGYQALNDADGTLQAQLDSCGASLLPAVWEALSRVGAMVREDSGAVSSISSPTLPEGCPVDYSKSSN